MESMAKVLNITTMLHMGLAALHFVSDLVHRDVKPGNLLLSANGKHLARDAAGRLYESSGHFRLALIDYGGTAPAGAGRGDCVATWLYSAPEQVLKLSWLNDLRRLAKLPLLSEEAAVVSTAADIFAVRHGAWGMAGACLNTRSTAFRKHACLVLSSWRQGN